MGIGMKKTLRAAVVLAAAAFVLVGCPNPLFDALRLLQMKLADGGSGSTDTSFNPGTGVSWAPPPGTVRTIALQDNGKIFIGGTFDSYNGILRNGLVRLLADGTLDTSYFTSIPNTVYGITILANESFLIGSAYAGPPAYLAKLDSAGNINSVFMPDITGGAVRGSIVLPDGRILIHGDFGTIGGVAHGCIGRLLASASGGEDATFQGSFTSAVTPAVAWVGRLSDGRLIAAGTFDHYAGLLCSRNIVRLGGNGSLDSTFNAGGAGVTGPTPAVFSGALQADGKILIGGMFTGFNTTTVNNLARLNPDGTLDTTFAAGGTGPIAPVRSIALQADGKILIGGQFTRYNNTNCGGFARLNADGSIDTTFDSSTGVGMPFVVGVAAITVQPDGRILIGGDFSSFNGVPRRGIARIWD